MLLSESFPKRASFSVTPGMYGFPDLVNYSHFVPKDPATLVMKEGSLFRAFLYYTPDLDFAAEAVRAELALTLKRALHDLQDGWMIHVHLLRSTQKGYPLTGKFLSATAQFLDGCREEYFEKAGNHFHSVVAISFTYHPPSPEQQWGRVLLSSKQETVDREFAYRQFVKGTEDFANLFQGQMHLRPLVGADLMSFLHWCVTGRQRRFYFPRSGVHVDTHVAGVDVVGGLSPQVDGRYMIPLTFLDYPPQGMPHLLRAFHDLPMEYMLSFRFIALSNATAVAELEEARNHWKGAVRGLASYLTERFVGEREEHDSNKYAQEMANEVDALIARIQSGEEDAGFFTGTIVVWGDEKNAAKEKADYIQALLQKMSFRGNIETVNAMEAIIGSFPGHGDQNVRRPLLTTSNVACMVPLTAKWRGQANNPNPLLPEGSSALAYVRSGSTAVFLNLHNGQLGHTLMVGPSRAGKSTLLSFLCQSALRYPNAQVFCFDRKRSLMPITLACNGAYYDLGNDEAVLAPLMAIQTEQGTTWALDWVEMVCAVNGYTVPREKRPEILQAFDLMRGMQKFSLFNFSMLIQDEAIRQVMKSYTQGGVRQGIVSADTDRVADAQFITFEVDDVMDKGVKSSQPALSAAIYGIERRFRAGKPTFIAIDEGGLILLNALMGDKIIEWLRSIARYNAYVCFVTQDLTDFLNLPQATLILNSCRSKIYLPNSEAETDYNMELYLRMGLSKEEIHVLAQATIREEYLLKTAEGTMKFRTDFSPAELAFYGVPTPQLERVKGLYQQHGEIWPGKWLAEKGLGTAAFNWNQLANEIVLKNEVGHVA